MDIKEYHLGVGLIIVLSILLIIYAISIAPGMEVKRQATFCAENFPRDDLYWDAIPDANATHCAYLDIHNMNSNLDYNKHTYLINDERKLELVLIELKHKGDE